VVLHGAVPAGALAADRQAEAPQQLEDFNAKKDEKSRKYVEDYHKGMDRQRGGRGAAEEDGGAAAAEMEAMGFKYVGCYGAENALGKDKVYGGGSQGSQFGLAVQFAAAKNKKYIAIATRGVDGHVFAFNEKPRKSKQIDDEGCDVPCADMEDYRCGCADEMCAEAGAPPIAGEDNTRRWVVYEVPLETLAAMQQQQQQKQRPAGRKSRGKSSRKAKSEL